MANPPVRKRAGRTWKQGMAKKDKIARKRAERRERAKDRGSDDLQDLNIGESEEIEEHKAVKTAPVAPPAPEPAREKRAPKEPKDEVEENWFHRTYHNISSFFREVIIEARKINWPSSPEATRSTWVVITAIVFLAAFMGAWSFVFMKITERIFSVPQVPTGIVQPIDSGTTAPASTDTTGGTGDTEVPQ
ncbi:MAG TPA: preprotein translocase subunit SecE [Firmicutes bacterium]|nr:preprotein translocase subunit SecE [Bacillota bacterium]